MHIYIYIYIHTGEVHTAWSLLRTLENPFLVPIKEPLREALKEAFKEPLGYMEPQCPFCCTCTSTRDRRDLGTEVALHIWAARARQALTEGARAVHDT